MLIYRTKFGIVENKLELFKFVTFILAKVKLAWF